MHNFAKLKNPVPSFEYCICGLTVKHILCVAPSIKAMGYSTSVTLLTCAHMCQNVTFSQVFTISLISAFERSCNVLVAL